MAYKRQVELPIRYKSVLLNAGSRLDLLVEEAVIVELKSVEALTTVHEAQLLTYLKLSKKRVGVLINFNTDLLKNGIVRRIVELR